MVVRRTDAQRRSPQKYELCECGLRLKLKTSRSCAPCEHAGRLRPPCNACGTPVRRSSAKLCLACYRRLRRTAELKRWFTPDWFRRILDDADAEWTPDLIEAATGGLVNAATVQRWLAGTYKPTEESWTLVARALCLDACRSCGGTGTAYNDAKAARLAPPKSKTPPVPHLMRPDRSSMPRALFVGGLVFDPDQRAIIAPDGTEIALTGRELELMAALLQLCSGRWSRPAELAEVLGWATNITTVNASRIRVKIRDAGHDWRKWWLLDPPRGWKLAVSVLNREEAAS